MTTYRATSAASTSSATSAAAVPGRARRPAKHRGLLAFGYLLLVLLALLYLFPFVIQIGTSFKTDAAATANAINPIPSHFTTAAYRQLFAQDFGRWFGNTVIVALIVTVGRVFFDSLAGYALARLRFHGRRILTFAIVATMAVPGVILLIPKFLIIKQLGIYDTYAAMTVPLLADAAGVFIMKQFFESIPLSLEEAAKLDGAGPFRTFWSVVLPITRPALITITIIAFQSSWNELPHMLISRQNPDLNTLTTGIAGLLTGQLGSGNRYPLKLAAAVLMTIPVAAVFLVFQRRIIGGTLEGGEKG